jgi:putative ABC transport system substrate-binding protein
MAGVRMRRREFLEILGAVIVTPAIWPIAAFGQQSAMPIIGFLSSLSLGPAMAVVAAFRNGLRETGFVEGKNLAIEFRWAEGHHDRLPALARELVGQRVSLLFASGGPPAALAAKSATTTIPIVFSAASDPVKLGLVESLSRPGGNITGMSAFATELAGKRLELAKELMPAARVIGYLLNPNGSNVGIELRQARDAAAAIGLELQFLHAGSADDFERAFADAAQRHVDAIIVAGGEPFFVIQRQKLVALAARHAIPAIYGWREFVAAGGLISYGTSLPDSYRRAAIYAGRILKGEKPADLPVMQPAKFDLTLNLSTAKALNLNIPATLLARADEVIG